MPTTALDKRSSGAPADSQAAGKGVGRYKWWALFLLILTYASNFMDRIVVATVGQAMKLDLDLSDLQLGLLGGMAFAFFYAVLGIPLARLSERFNRVKIIAACTLLWSAMTTLCGFAQHYTHLLLFRIGVGVGEAGSTPAAHSLLADYFPSGRRGTAFALYSLGVPIGAIIGAFGGGWIVQNIGWREAFIYMGAPGIVLAALVLFTVREPERGSTDSLVGAAAVPPFRAVLRLLARKSTFLHLAFGCALIGFANFGINMFIPIFYSRVFHMSYAQAGLAFGVITGVGSLIGTMLGGYLADWAGKRDARWYLWVVAIGVGVAAPLYMLAFIQSSWLVSVVMMLVFGSFMYMWYGPTFAIAYTLVGARMRASCSAIILLITTLLGQGLGPVFNGWLSDRFTREAFTHGSYLTVCGKGASEAGSEIATACSQASASGIRSAMMVCALMFMWGAFHYYWASRSLIKDKEPI
ncbi:MAG: MFS transporter [Rhodanobacter sp.]